MPNIEFCVWQKISICPQNTCDEIAETKLTSQQLLVQVPSRDLMLNDFFTKKMQMVTALKNVEDLEKLKRSDG